MRVVLVVGSRLAGSAFQFALSIALARLVGAGGVGVYFLFVYWAGLIATVCAFGTPIWVLKSTANLPTAAREITRRAERLVVRGWLFLVPFAFAIGWILPSRLGYSLVTVILLLVSGLFLALVRVRAESLKSIGRPQAGLTVEFTAIPACVLGLCGLTVISGRDLSDSIPVAFYTVGVALSYAVAWGMSRHWMPPEPTIAGLGVAPPTRRELTTFAGIQLMNAGFASAPYLVLPWVSSREGIGLFAIAHRLVAITATLQAALGALFSPRFAAIGRRDAAAVGRTLRGEFLISQVVTLGAYLPVFVAFVARPEAILAIFGAEFRAAVPLLLILAVARLVNAAAGLGEQALTMTGRERFELGIAFALLAGFMAFSSAAAFASSGIETIAALYGGCYALRGVFSGVVVWGSSQRTNAATRHSGASSG